MDVLAINHTLIVINVFIWALAIFVQLYFLPQKTLNLNSNGLYFFGITFFIFICLVINTYQLQNQVYKALIPFFTALRNKHLV